MWCAFEAASHPWLYLQFFARAPLLNCVVQAAGERIVPRTGRHLLRSRNHRFSETLVTRPRLSLLNCLTPLCPANHHRYVKSSHSLSWINFFSDPFQLSVVVLVGGCMMIQPTFDPSLIEQLSHAYCCHVRNSSCNLQQYRPQWLGIERVSVNEFPM